MLGEGQGRRKEKATQMKGPCIAKAGFAWGRRVWLVKHREGAGANCQASPDSVMSWPLGLMDSDHSPCQNPARLMIPEGRGFAGAAETLSPADGQSECSQDQ